MNQIIIIGEITQTDKEYIEIKDSYNNKYYLEQTEENIMLEKNDKITLIGQIKKQQTKVEEEKIKNRTIIETILINIEEKKKKEIDINKYQALAVNMLKVLEKIGQKEKITQTEKEGLEKLALTPHILILKEK